MISIPGEFLDLLVKAKPDSPALSRLVKWADKNPDAKSVASSALSLNQFDFLVFRKLLKENDPKRALEMTGRESYLRKRYLSFMCGIGRRVNGSTVFKTDSGVTCKVSRTRSREYLVELDPGGISVRFSVWRFQEMLKAILYENTLGNEPMLYELSIGSTINERSATKRFSNAISAAVKDNVEPSLGALIGG